MATLMITLTSDASGGPRHVADLSMELLKYGERIDIASPVSEPLGPVFQRQSEHFLELPHRRFSPSAWWRLLKFVRRQKYNLIHSHGRGAGLYSRTLKPFIDAKVIHTFHGVNESSNWPEIVKRAIDCALAHRTDLFISVSEPERLAIERTKLAGNRPITVIKNGVSTTRFAYQPSSNSIIPFHVGIFMRNDPVKGIDIFFREVVQHQDKYRRKGVRFHIAGITANESAKLPQAVADLVDYEGVIDSVSFLKRMHALASFSHSEGMPLTVLEALSSGVPCLLSNIPAHTYFIKTCMLFDPKNDVDFCQKLLELASDPLLQSEMARKGRELVEREHTTAKMAECTVRTYQFVLNNSEVQSNLL